MEIQKLKPIDLKTSTVVNEKWIQEQIANDPLMLGLGDIVLKDKERIQPNAGRLDLLFQDSEANKRYEVELQLGKTDESHIIRTIGYVPKQKNYAVLISIGIIFSIILMLSSCKAENQSSNSMWYTRYHSLAHSGGGIIPCLILTLLKHGRTLTRTERAFSMQT